MMPELVFPFLVSLNPVLLSLKSSSISAAGVSQMFITEVSGMVFSQHLLRIEIKTAKTLDISVSEQLVKEKRLNTAGSTVQKTQRLQLVVSANSKFCMKDQRDKMEFEFCVFLFSFI